MSKTARRYNTEESRNRRQIVIKRQGKEFKVVEGRNTLFESSNFDLCCEFLEKELNPKASEVRIMQ
tara:strand:- start:24726 stop:24923 length:198 start_codon:yes stop_codon:yes gene_type:complete